ncbi:MAG: O-antigen ligase family protein [Elusimicrobiota bacterium]
MEISAKQSNNFILNGIILLLFISPLPFGSVNILPLSILELAIFSLFFYWAVKQIAGNQPLAMANPLYFLIGGFLLFGLAQWRFWSVYPDAVKQELLKILAYALVFFLAAANFKTKEQVNKLCVSIILLGFLLSLFGIIQQLSGSESMFWFKELASRPDKGFFASFVNHNHFAGYLGMVIPLSFGCIYALGRQNLEKKILLSFFVVIMLAAAFLSLSRGGIFSLLFSLVFFFPVIFRLQGVKKTWIIFFIVFVAGFLYLCWIGIGPVIDKLQSLSGIKDTFSYAARLSVWQDTVQLAKDHFLGGAGLGTYGYIFPRYKTLTEQLVFTHAHNEYLQLWAEAGIAGLAVVLAGLVYWFLKIFFFIFKSGDRYRSVIACGCFAGTAAILLQSFVDFSLRIPANGFLFSVIAGLGFGIQDNIPRGLILSGWKKIAGLIGLTAIFLMLSGSVTKTVFAEYWAKQSLSAQAATGRKIIFLRRATKLAADKAEYWARLAGLEKQLDKRQALNLFNRAIKLNPNNSFYYRQAALLSGALGKDRQMGEALQQALYCEPSNPYTHYLLGRYYFFQAAKTGNGLQRGYFVRQGEKFCRQAIEFKPAFADKCLQDYFKLTRDYRQLKKIFPSQDNRVSFLAVFLQDNKAWEENKKAFQQDLLLAKDKTPYLLAIAQYYYRKKDYAQAISLMQGFVRTYPQNAELHFTLADWLFYWKKEKSLAMQEAERALKLDPNNNYYRYWYAKWLYYQGMYQKSLQECQTILTKNPSDRLTKELVALLSIKK